MKQTCQRRNMSYDHLFGFSFLRFAMSIVNFLFKIKACHFGVKVVEKWEFVLKESSV